jgi:hypothetical protein
MVTIEWKLSNNSIVANYREVLVKSIVVVGDHRWYEVSFYSSMHGVVPGQWLWQLILAIACFPHWNSFIQYFDSILKNNTNNYEIQMLCKCNSLKYLFNDAVYSSFCLTSNDGMIKEWWIGEDMEGNVSGLIWGTIPAFTRRERGKPQSV